MNNEDLEKIDFKTLDYHLRYKQETAAQFAVLLLLVDYEGQLQVLFELRSKTLNADSQPGDISLPGGYCESADVVAEALRETQEEIGVPAQAIEIHGVMEALVAGSERLITPVVGHLPDFSWDMLELNREEVEAVFLVPLSFFVETKPQQHFVAYTPVFGEDFPFDKITGGRDYRWKTRGEEFSFYYYRDYTIWGFTAAIIRQFVNILAASARL